MTTSNTTPRIPQRPADIWQEFADATLDHDQPAAVTAEQRILQLLGAIGVQS